MSDEGMYDFFGSLDDYYRVSPEHAEILGWELVDFPIKDSEYMAFTIETDDYESDRAKTVTYGKTINQDRKNTESVKNPFPKYKERMKRNLETLNWEIVKFFGEKMYKNWKGWDESPSNFITDLGCPIKSLMRVCSSFQLNGKHLHRARVKALLKVDDLPEESNFATSNWTSSLSFAKATMSPLL